MDELGFRDVTYRQGSTTVTSATPDSVRALIYTKASDPNGRPVSYLHVGGGRQPQDGSWAHVTTAVLDRTVNAHGMQTGVAYPTFYSSAAESHVAHLRELAAAAREEKAGVWAVDQTALFQLVDQESVGPHGQLILPKLFRRATDYLKDVATGFHGNLADWLKANAAGTRKENDIVVLPGGVEVPMSSLIEQRNSFVAFSPDLLDIVFLEK
jgi:hypothetical protein